MQRIRISKNAFAAGFRLKHIGEVLYASVKNEFEAVVDKCEVVIYTDPAECTRIRHEVAIPTFDKRDDRLKNLTAFIAATMTTTTLLIGIWRGRIWGLKRTRQSDGASPGSCWNGMTQS